MGKVLVSLSMSLDGFIAGPNDGPENSLGDCGSGYLSGFFSGGAERNLHEQDRRIRESVT